MKILDTSGLDRALMRSLSQNEVSWAYNGLDCCVTFEIHEALQEELARSGPNVQQTYREAMAKQAAFLEMSMRGIRVDEAVRTSTVKKLEAQLRELDGRFQRLMKGAFGHGLNWDSPAQLKTLFYGELGLPEIKKRNTKGQFVATVNEEALERLQQNFFAKPLCKYILAMRNLRKQLGFLKTEIDPDGRFRANINIAGTNTGRSSSSRNDFGSGSNLQNVDNRLRFPFIADPKKILVNIDLEQADARNVGAIMHDLFYESHGPEEAGKYLDACESGDLHTQVCRMAWGELPWTGAIKQDRKIAEQDSGHGMSFRDLAKRLGHGTNYYGTPPTMAKHTHTAVPVVAEFQKRYFGAFPLIQTWHEWVIQEVKEVGVLTTPFGRRRHFFGRGNDASTWRKAIAYAPQSMTGHEMDMGILNLWREMPEAELLMQVHDSILFQVPWHNHQSHVERALELLAYRHQLKGDRIFSVPLEAMVGWNWGKVKYDDEGRPRENLYGITVWKGEEKRTPAPTLRLKDYL